MSRFKVCRRQNASSATSQKHVINLNDTGLHSIRCVERSALDRVHNFNPNQPFPSITKNNCAYMSWDESLVGSADTSLPLVMSHIFFCRFGCEILQSVHNHVFLDFHASTKCRLTSAVEGKETPSCAREKIIGNPCRTSILSTSNPFQPFSFSHAAWWYLHLSFNPKG